MEKTTNQDNTQTKSKEITKHKQAGCGKKHKQIPKNRKFF
jgi:hypothetical protein